MPDLGLTKNVFLRNSVKVSFSGSPQHPKSNKPTSYRYDTFLNALQKSVIEVSLKYHAALRHPEISKPQSLARATKPHKQTTNVPNRGKQRSHLGQASCPFSEDLLCLPMVDFFIFSKLAKWEICRIKRMKISLCHVFCILLPNDRQGREYK